METGKRFLLWILQRAHRVGEHRSGCATGDSERSRSGAARAPGRLSPKKFPGWKEKVCVSDWLFGKPFVILTPHFMAGSSIPRVSVSADLNNYRAVVLFR
jgi:hypothetical protein